MCSLICPVCSQPKKENNKYCSFRCRNIVINSNKDYVKLALKLSITNREKAEKLRIEKTVECFRCSNNITIKSNTKGLFKDVYYCNRNCANSRPQTEETKRKIGAKIKEIFVEQSSVGGIKYKNKPGCLNCQKIILNRGKFCNKKCKNIFKRKDIPLYKIYKNQTSFKFGVKTYIDHFDFSLIEKYGWYKAKNHGDNLNGVSRDHIISVRDGFEKCINPLLLAHPANCVLMTQRNNSSKSVKSAIDINELLERIKNFDCKYGRYYKEDLPIYVDIEKIIEN